MGHAPVEKIDATVGEEGGAIEAEPHSEQGSVGDEAQPLDKASIAGYVPV